MRTWLFALLFSVLQAMPAAARDESIYQLKTPLRDQTGAAVELGVHRGHPVLISMFYGTCPAACPMLVSRLRQVDEALPANVRADARFLLVSFDAARDTPAALATLFKAHGVNAGRWRFASTPDPQARELAAVLGISYRRVPDGFEHDSRIILLDRTGVMVGSFDAFDIPPEQIAARIRQVAGQQPSAAPAAGRRAGR